jgi:hypothetical protein
VMTEWKKVGNWSELHSWRSNFLQNPHFRDPSRTKILTTLQRKNHFFSSAEISNFFQHYPTYFLFCKRSLGQGIRIWSQFLYVFGKKNHGHSFNLLWYSHNFVRGQWGKISQKLKSKHFFG